MSGVNGGVTRRRPVDRAREQQAVHVTWVEAERWRKAHDVRVMYEALQPGDTLTFQRGNEEGGFMSVERVHEEKTDKLRVDWTWDLPGKEATVIRHLHWDDVHPYNRLYDKFADYDDPDHDEMCAYAPEPNFEWYEVECDGRRLYAGRWHVTEEERRRSVELEAELTRIHQKAEDERKWREDFERRANVVRIPD